MGRAPHEPSLFLLTAGLCANIPLWVKALRACIAMLRPSLFAPSSRGPNNALQCKDCNTGRTRTLPAVESGFARIPSWVASILALFIQVRGMEKSKNSRPFAIARKGMRTKTPHRKESSPDRQQHQEPVAQGSEPLVLEFESTHQVWKVLESRRWRSSESRIRACRQWAARARRCRDAARPANAPPAEAKSPQGVRRTSAKSSDLRFGGHVLLWCRLRATANAGPFAPNSERSCQCAARP